MSADRSHLVNPGSRLPDLALPSVPTGDPLHLQPRGRFSSVLVLTHDLSCVACLDFIRQLESEQALLGEWDGRLRVVLPSLPTDPTVLVPHGDSGLAVLTDPDGRVVHALGLALPAMVIADQWRQVHVVDEAGEDHHFLPFSEILSWVQYLAVQCPECEGEAL